MIQTACLILVGVLTGIFSGLLGIGGGTIAIPWRGPKSFRLRAAS